MEIDQCLLESLPLGQRQRLVRRMRCDQLRAYYERERTLQKQSGHKPRSHRKKHAISFPLSDILQDAVIRHDDKEVLRLLKEEADPNTLLSSGGSLLHLCARHDNVFAAEVLIERGVNVNLQDEDLWTALHVACACDHADTVLLLLSGNLEEICEEKLCVDVSSMHQMKTQRASVMLSDVKQLVSSGASVNQRNEDGVTLLHMACASGYREVVSLLLENGADVQCADNTYWTPLHLAAKYGQVNTSTDGPFSFPDIAASDLIADMLLKAEGFWVQKQKEPTAQPPHLDEHCEDLNQDISMPVKKLSPMALPISKRDSLLEKDAAVRDSGGGLTRQSSQDNLLDGSFPSTTNKLEQVKLMPPAPNDDLASLSELTDSSLLYEMQKRFGNDQIYTYIGHILLLINPNKDLPIYSNLVSQLYLSSSGRLCSSLPPHIFSSAERAYHMMLQERRPQCFIIRYSLFICKRCRRNVNAILEAFGHAKTPMNSNASRFMKLLSLQYCEKRRTLLRARVYTYMLEKSRLVNMPQNQQNFNIFYLMAEGLSAEEKSNLYLNNVLAHRYLNSGAPGEASAVGTEVENVFVVLAALLHLGDLRFTALTDAEAVLVSDLQLLDRVAGMLQLSPEDLSSALTSDVQYFKGDVITRRHTVEMSNHHRDLLAKALYGRLFSFLVNNINFYLQGQDESIGDPAFEIGILDVFGFEKFQKNSFEQLCVNMLNERIQQYTAEVLFQQEQQECLQEGIAMETLRSPANQPAVLDFFYQIRSPCVYFLFFSLHPSLFSLSSLSLRAASENVLIHQMFQCKLTQTGSLVPPLQRLQQRGPKGALLLQRMSSPSPARDSKKYLELSKLLKKKGATSFLQKLERCGPVSVAVQLRNSLSEINSKLQACTPHFVQCVRPNASGQAETFDSFLVSTQLQYVGVLEMVHMIRYGYPVRLPFSGFLSRYRELVETILTDKKKMLAEEKCRHVLQHCKLQGWQLGTSKVFLRYWQADHLNDRCHQLQKKIVTCQKVVRGWLVRQRVHRRLSYQQREQCNVQRFLQGAEDLGLRAYDSLVIQNAADIARENDRLRGHNSGPPLGERPEPVGKEEDSPKRHFRSSSVPIPLAMDNLVHSGFGPSIKAALQTVTHSSEDGGGGGLSSPRKQPPPKPKRDPNTRLSASYEHYNVAPVSLSKPRPHSDDYSTMKKIPPPKPKRSPNTKLTGSYEEISAPTPMRPTDMKLACLARGGHLLGLVQRAASEDSPHSAMLTLRPGQDEEDVYIEMVGAWRAMNRAESRSPEQGEAVYEEMKYFPPEDGVVVPQAKPEVCEPAPVPLPAPQMLEPKRPVALLDHPNMLVGRQLNKDGTACDIPAPFPNLLPHRPPLLVFPPSPVTCSPASDESPLTPLEVKKLPVFETNLNYSSQDGGSPLSPQYTRQRADSSPSLSILMPDKSTPPLTPPPQPPAPPPSLPPPPYRPPSHFPFPPEANFLALTRAASVASTDSPKPSHKGGHVLAETPPASAKPPYSPVKSSRPEPRRAHSCSSSPLLFNPANGRALTSPLDELNTLFSSGRSLLRKSTTGRKIRDSGESKCVCVCY
uniref:Myosin XVI n=1 Tax=Astyanax mexicanus TaxID=7994 RepID=A0A8B9GQR9_ASTMX